MHSSVQRVGMHARGLWAGSVACGLVGCSHGAWQHVAVGCTSQQACRLPVQAYPWCPDALALFNAIAREEGAPGEQELLACPSVEDQARQPGLATRTRSAMQR
jgi:hypothetical protein